MTDCRICRGISESFARAIVMGRYDVEYFRCRDCQFIQTEQPYWLDEAYGDSIISTDVGMISRNERFARITDRLLSYAYPRAFQCLDYCGGYGVFTRMMRDRGHHFLHSDPHCENLFAAGLDANAEESEYDFATAFEVFEHFVDPHRELTTLDRTAEHWFVSTNLVPDPAPLPDQWWYYALESGQHVSLWSQRSMQAVAYHYGRTLVSHRGLHLFSKTEVKPSWIKFLLRDRASRFLDPFRRRRSLLEDDFLRAAASVPRAA